MERRGIGNERHASTATNREDGEWRTPLGRNAGWEGFATDTGAIEDGEAIDHGERNTPSNRNKFRATGRFRSSQAESPPSRVRLTVMAVTK